MFNPASVLICLSLSLSFCCFFSPKKKEKKSEKRNITWNEVCCSIISFYYKYVFIYMAPTAKRDYYIFFPSPFLLFFHFIKIVYRLSSTFFSYPLLSYHYYYYCCFDYLQWYSSFPFLYWHACCTLSLASSDHITRK